MSGTSSTAHAGTSSPAPRLSVGDQAPDFDLPATGGGRVRLADLAGAPALIYHYPQASTPLCTTQACDLRDNYELFTRKGYQVFGVSPDPAEALERFVREESLPFTLLSDEDHTMMTAWGTWADKNMYGRIVRGTIRSTFALDEHGVITFAKYRVGTPKHIAVLTAALHLGREGAI
ncbi:peroxiredoxin [Devriesea agamarum]|uniref:peroxiredoxin n=1 Tax=Devriesea agamarum TaxID=472569 RepID=UPI00071C9380|nr:peroxiredoxin [Devriesea agamarum]